MAAQFRSRSLLTSLSRFAPLLVGLAVFAAEAARPYRRGAVAAAHPVGSQAGLVMLAKGGNAIDAAVAAAFAMGVVGPYHSGLGGGGFALVYEAKKGEAAVLDFREVAPKAARRDMFVRDGKVVPGMSTDGGLSVAVPGAVKGYLELLAKYGKLPPKVVLAPAIRAARTGFFVTPKYRAMAESRLECLRQDPEATRLFLRDASPPSIGSKIVQPELARTLETLARGGPQAFYQGKVARAIAETVRAHGGVLTAEDLSAYRTTWRKPLAGSYRGHQVLTMPPPSAGGLAVVQVLGALELLGSEGPVSRKPEVLHRYIEAVRRAYLDRARYLGDPAFVDVPTERLSSPAHIEELARSIDPKHATPSSTLSPLPEHTDGGEAKKNTTHISVIDAEGNAVSLTTTVNYMFGSCLVAKGTGVLLNDEMDDFAAQPLVPNAYGLVTGEANAIAPGKIPLSSMAPTLVFAKEKPNQVLLAIGSPGGSTIPTTVIQVISNLTVDQFGIGSGRESQSK
ncbi:MAG: gamma-glutamyltransferase [Myxococcota bacterium]